MTNGLLVGLMYALVAVGFVLIYKATSIINFAQGDLVMFAGYGAAVMLGLRGLPLWLMVLILCIGMIALGFVLERGILRPMVGQPLVSVIMVTIGLSFVLQGLVAMVWGAGTRKLELPVPLAPYVVGPVLISPINVVAAVIALVFLIRVSRVFALAWAIAGLAAAAGGIIWGNMLGASSLLSLVGLKVFPVVILGGLDSIGGAIVGGLILGAVESVAAGYLDPYVGGGTKDFIPYVLMILVLFIRPYGIWGHETIERV